MSTFPVFPQGPLLVLEMRSSPCRVDRRLKYLSSGEINLFFQSVEGIAVFSHTAEHVAFNYHLTFY